jgi:hypothetical protein
MLAVKRHSGTKLEKKRELSKRVRKKIKTALPRLPLYPKYKCYLFRRKKLFFIRMRLESCGISCIFAAH